MESDLYIAEQLAKTGAYTDLVDPVILTSGQLGIFYINTEKLLRDGGEFKKYGNNSRAMIAHAMKQMAIEPEFERVIDIICEEVSHFGPDMLAGGQRRDWPFSGPVAMRLGLSHMSIYKDGTYEIIDTTFNRLEDKDKVKGCVILPIADLLTEGSSFYNTPGLTHPTYTGSLTQMVLQGLKSEKIKALVKEQDIRPTGWLAAINSAGGHVNNAITVVNRLQGGDKMARELGVEMESFVYIDEGFLTKHSSQPETAMAYVADPTAWSENYLRENGAMGFIDAFNPKAGKLDRAKKFVLRFRPVLEEIGELKKLDNECRSRYSISLEELTREVA